MVFSSALLKGKVSLFFLWMLSKREIFFVFLMYTIETWSIFCFSRVCYCNVKYFCFSCTPSKPELLFFFFKYTIEMWSSFFFPMYTIKTWRRFCFSHVHCRNVKKFLIFSCIVSKREVFFVSLMYTTETWSVFVFLIETWGNFSTFLRYPIET